MRITLIQAFLVPAAASLALAACGPRATVQLGAVLPLSGPHRIYGEESRRGLELALDELRADPRLELTIADSASDPAKARQLARQLYEDGAVAVVGGMTAVEAREMAEVAEVLERVLLSPSAALGRSAPSRHFFSLAPSGHTAGTTMGGFAVRRLGVGSAVVVRRPGASGLEEGFRATFEAQGGQLLASVESIDEALGHRPDAVFLTGCEPGTSALVRDLRRRQFQGKILTTQAFAVPASIRRLGEDAVDVLLTHTVFERDEEHVASFTARYREKYGDEPGIFAAESYDALRVLAAAVADRPALPSEVRKGLLHDVRDFPGVTGPIRFDEKGSASRIPRVYSVGEDLALRDHNQWLEKEKDDLLIRLVALREEMETKSGQR